jgi:hypothetical protein
MLNPLPYLLVVAFVVVPLLPCLVVICMGFLVGLGFGLKLLGFALTLVTNAGSVVNCHCGLDPDCSEFWLWDVMKPGSVVDCHPGFVYTPIDMLLAPERASVCLGGWVGLREDKFGLTCTEAATVCPGGGVGGRF